MDRLEEIKARCEAATPGQWLRGIAQDGEYTGPGDNPSGTPGDDYETGEIITEDGYSIGYIIGDNDAAFAAHAREDIPWLLGEIEYLTATVEAYKVTAARLTAERDAALRRAEAAEKERDAYKRAKDYWDDLYGQGYEIAYWHMNGALEPYDNFWQSAQDEFEKGGPADEA